MRKRKKLYKRSWTSYLFLRSRDLDFLDRFERDFERDRDLDFFLSLSLP